MNKRFYVRAKLFVEAFDERGEPIDVITMPFDSRIVEPGDTLTYSSKIHCHGDGLRQADEEKLKSWRDRESLL